MPKSKSTEPPSINHRERWLASGRLLLSVILGFFVVTVIAIIFGGMATAKYQSSANAFDLHAWGDWLVVGTLLVALCWGGWSAWYYLARQRDSKWWYWLGNFGALGAVGAAVALIEEFHMKLIGHLTISNVKLTVNSVSIVYTILFGLFVAMLFGSLLVNRHWTRKNNWYVFATAAPYVVIEAFLYRNWLQWQNFLGLKAFSYQKVYDMIQTYNHTGFGHAVELASMNAPVKILIGLALFDLSITLIVGGMFIVQEASRKIRGKKSQKGSTQSREASTKAG